MDQKHIMEQLKKFLENELIGEFTVERRPNKDILLKKNTSELISCTKQMNKK